jgi:predicted enzyme related to lactoylglutathione lyase
MSIPGTPAWVEVSSEDPAASREFYGRLLGWTYEVLLDPYHHGYTIALHGGERVAGLYEASEGVPPGWLLYLHATDVEAVRGRVAALGGRTVVGPVDLPRAGRALLTTDPTGAAVGFWQPTTDRRLATGRVGALSWVELTTRDPAAADRFYGALFGYEERQLGDGGAVDHKTWSKDGFETAGRLRAPAGPPVPPSRWMVYFAVDPAVGTDASVEQATALGGEVGVPPFDSPHGRVAVVRDPFGAVFSLVDLERRVAGVGPRGGGA